VIKNLIRAFDDKIEKNREIALNILQLYLNIPRNSEIPLDLAEIIIKSLISRLNQIPYLETSKNNIIYIYINIYIYIYKKR
jgi:hypothetical protein